MSTTIDTSTDRGTDRGPRRRRRMVAIVTVATVAAAGVVGAILLTGSDDPAEPTLSDLPEGSVAAVEPEGGALLDLLAAGATLTFHATYRAEASDGEVAGELQLDLFRHDGWVRQDSTVTAGEEAARTRAILAPDGMVTSCLEQGGQWTCARSSQPAQDVFGSLAEQLAAGDVTTSSATVADLEATCHALTDASGRSELCVTEDGIPVRITASDGTTMELVALEREVAPEAFEPPAEPVSADE